MGPMETLVEALESARKAGFVHTFRVEGGALRCVETGKAYSPEQVRIVHHHRFEGESSEDDAAVLYEVECAGGVKGTIVDAYGTYSDAGLAEFLKRVRVQRDENVHEGGRS